MMLVPDEVNLYHLIALYFFFFVDAAPTLVCTLSLHDALPILLGWLFVIGEFANSAVTIEVTPIDVRSLRAQSASSMGVKIGRAQSELQSRFDLVCRLLLEKKNNPEALRYRVRRSEFEVSKRNV